LEGHATVLCALFCIKEKKKNSKRSLGFHFLGSVALHFPAAKKRDSWSRGKQRKKIECLRKKWPSGRSHMASLALHFVFFLLNFGFLGNLTIFFAGSGQLTCDAFVTPKTFSVNTFRRLVWAMLAVLL
jgi:hypothetical protein